MDNTKRCPQCGYHPDTIPSDFDAYAQANCPNREKHAFFEFSEAWCINMAKLEGDSDSTTGCT